MDLAATRPTSLAVRRPGPGALAAVLGAVFVAGSLVWLHLDRGVPVYDGGMHLWMALDVRDALAAGHPFYGFAEFTNYPPLVHMLGALALLVGGLNADAPVVALIVIFLPLYVAGLYFTGRFASGPTAGLLAVIFGLASPLFVLQIRTFMLDAPEAALVAATVAALLAADRFRRPWLSALAGALCGLGLMTKQSFAAFVAGTLVVLLARGGWRRWRGLLAFVVPVLVIAGPWYIDHLQDLRQLSHMATDLTPRPGPGSNLPPRWSTENLAWYGWVEVNVALLLPLCLFALTGTAISVVRFARRRDPADVTPELVTGLVVGWVITTLAALHDPRYVLPALVFLAVLGTGWITRLPTRARTIAVVALVGAAVATTIGDTFGPGHRAAVHLDGPTSSWIHERAITFYDGDGYQGIGAPRRQADLQPILDSLRAQGFQRVVGPTVQFTDFSPAGVIALTDLARLTPIRGIPPNQVGPRDADLVHTTPALIARPPCLTLFDGSGVWIIRGDPTARNPDYICPR